MKLPKKLVSEFVKVTNTNTSTKTKTETTVYGTIVKDGESTYAQLDGSEILTPVSSTTDTQDGDRVTILIKNHTATVTGNLTSPSARTDDVQTMTDDASKTATNFLDYDETNGLQMGNKSSGSWNGFRTQTTGSAFSILDSLGTIVASYGAKLIELGKNATDAVIRLCGGKGQIEYASSDDSSENYLQISSEKLRLKSDSMTSVYSSTTNGSGTVDKSAVNVSPTNVYIYSGTSNISLDSDSIDISTPGDTTINSSSIRDTYGQFLSVVEETSGIWSYKKWSNGVVELWGNYSISNLSCSTEFGNAMYRTDPISITAFPFTVYAPNLTASYESDGYGGILWAESATTQQGPPSYYLLRPTSATIVSGKIIFHVYGKWST